MDKFKKFFIFFFCVCIAFFPLVNTLTVHAEESNKLSDIYGFDFSSRKVFTSSGWENSPLYKNNSNHFGFVSSPNSTLYDMLDNLTLPSGIDFDKYPLFFIWSYSANWSSSDIYVYLFEPNIRVASGYNCNGFGYPYDRSTKYCFLTYSVVNGSYVLQNSQLDLDIPTNNNNKIGLFTSDRDTGRFIASNIDHVYGSNSSTYTQLYDNCIGWDIPNDDFYKINYLIYDSNGNIDYNNPITNPVYEETSSNNLYMDNAKWSFDIPYYSLDQSGAVYGTGTATFSGSLNEFQINNTSDFTLEFLFTSFLSGYRYSWAQDSQKEDFSYKYIYSTEIPLSDFYSNGQVASFNISDIFDNSISVNPTHLGTSITEDCQVISNSQAVNISNWNTTFTVALKSNDNYSGKCSTMYSYLLRKSKNKDNSMQTNENPFLGEEGSNSSPDSDIFNGDGVSGSSGNSNSTANIGDYSVVNNNNPQITINNNNDNGFTNAIENGDSDGLLSKLLLLLANNQSTTSNGLSEIADTDGYVQVMGSVFTAVPAAWWTTLTVAFVACIGILVVSFVIKIILKFVI